MDLHSEAIPGFFDIPTDNLMALPIFSDYFRQLLPNLNSVVTVSPDAGGTARARAFAEALGTPLAIIEKRRNPETGKVTVFNVIGRVNGKTAIIIDDIISSGTTLVEAAGLLHKEGAEDVWSGVIHGIFSGNAVKTIESSQLKRVVVSDTVPLQKQSSMLKQISVTGIFADTIRRIQENRSVSTLFLK
jgi:ribose-phosphate pyrophosphokinase